MKSDELKSFKQLQKSIKKVGSNHPIFIFAIYNECIHSSGTAKHWNQAYDKFSENKDYTFFKIASDIDTWSVETFAIDLIPASIAICLKEDHSDDLYYKEGEYWHFNSEDFLVDKKEGVWHKYNAKKIIEWMKDF